MVVNLLRAKFSRNLERMAACQKGTTAVILAVAAVPFVACAGAAIDFAYFAAARTHLQAALDTGALAAASPDLDTDSGRIAAAQASYAANMRDGVGANLTHAANFSIENNKVISRAEIDVPMHFMTLVGITEMAAVAVAEVGIAKEKKAEIALVLDYSASMSDALNGEVKYQAMTAAATNLVNDIAATASDKVKVGLVPFSHQVYATLPGSYVVGGGSASWTGCTQDRRYPANTTSATPSSASSTKWNQAMAPVHASWGCSGYLAHNLRIVPLTNNFSVITNRLAAMTPYAWTHIALGVEFGYHLLSPNPPYSEGVDFSDSQTRKFMVVLTDGMQTEPAFGPGTTRTVTQGELNLETLCDNAKADGITIITMAFDLDDSDTRQRLRACASDPDKYFFVADDTADLMSAFDTVKAAVVAEVYLSK